MLVRRRGEERRSGGDVISGVGIVPGERERETWPVAMICEEFTVCVRERNRECPDIGSKFDPILDVFSGDDEGRGRSYCEMKMRQSAMQGRRYMDKKST